MQKQKVLFLTSVFTLSSKKKGLKIHNRNKGKWNFLPI